MTDSASQGTWPYKSALALRYPTKPAEVADDIESFIYVILYFAMRFHIHDLSSDAPKGSSIEVQRAANAANEGLSAMFFDLFHAAERRPNGRSVGGNWKELCIRTAYVPIKLEEDEHGRPTPLARFLEKAYLLMQRHYKRVNHAALQRFALKPEKRHQEMIQQRTLAQKNPEDGGLNLRAKLNLLKRRPEGAHYSPSSRGSTPSSEASSSSLRPLDSHDALFELLDKAFLNEDGSPMDISWYRLDTLYDQCLGQNVMTSSRRKNYTGVDLSKLLAIARSGELRSLSEDSAATGLELPSIMEEEEPQAQDEIEADPGPATRSRTARKRTTRKGVSPEKPPATRKKSTSARKNATSRKAKSAAGAQKTATMRKATASRKSKVAPGRRSARLAGNDAPSPPSTGKRKRNEIDEADEAVVDAPILEVAATKRKLAAVPKRTKLADKVILSAKNIIPTDETENSQQVLVRRSTRLAVKAARNA